MIEGMKKGAEVTVIHAFDTGDYQVIRAMMKAPPLLLDFAFTFHRGDVEGLAVASIDTEYHCESKAMTTHAPFTFDSSDAEWPLTNDDPRKASWEAIQRVGGALMNAPSTVTRDELLTLLRDLNPNEFDNLCLDEVEAD